MPDPSSFRDSTQIVLPEATLEDYVDDIEAQFQVSIFQEGENLRVVGSPLVIKDVSEFLSRHGVSVP